jgi:hypothetical protein
VVGPAAGGDTLWANTAAAYAHLAPPLRDLADRLWAVHSNEYDYAAVKPHISTEQLDAYRKVFTSTVYETEHPVVRVHPVSGERALLLGHFVKRIKGYGPADSAQLFNLLQGHVTRPENTVRWRWQAGDVAIWDNRATQHYAVDDYCAQPRVVRRVTVAGDVPFSVDGTRSETLRRTLSAIRRAGQRRPLRWRAAYCRRLPAPPIPPHRCAPGAPASAAFDWHKTGATRAAGQPLSVPSIGHVPGTPRSSDSPPGRFCCTRNRMLRALLMRQHGSGH